MSDVPEDAVRLVSGILGHLKQIVGEGASYSMLHYGALEEGKRVGVAYGAIDLALLLGRFDAILAQRSEVEHDDGEAVRVRVHSSELLRSGHRAAQGIVVGLLEGALCASRNARYRASVLAPSAPGAITIEFTRAG